MPHRLATARIVLFSVEYHVTCELVPRNTDHELVRDRAFSPPFFNSRVFDKHVYSAFLADVHNLAQHYSNRAFYEKLDVKLRMKIAQTQI